MMNKISAVFGSHVFSDQVMRERLPKAVYKSLKATIDKGEPLDTVSYTHLTLPTN